MKKFDEWNEVKKKIDKKEYSVHIKNGEIYFLSIGQNIGYEIYGKQEQFLRPVLIYKKLSKYTFLGIPLTSQIKEGDYFFNFSYKKDKISTALIHQMRVFDTKRIVYFSGRIPKNDYESLKMKVKNFVDITPKRGGITPENQEQRNMNKILSQNDKKVNQVFIIAEAGVNHNGSLEFAKKLVDVACEVGVDAIKFQTFKAKNLVTKQAKMAEYQKQNFKETSQYEMLKSFELGFDEFIELKNYCDKKGIMFLSTPFDDESIEFLDNLGLEIFKIPSGEITNLPYLRKIGALQKKIILSTGMSNLSDIESALDILESAGTKRENITILHANTEYPTPFEDVNLKAMITIKEAFKVDVGYSDHTLGIEIPIAAVAMGAKVIEKHFTLDKNMSGPDHKASLEPHELQAMTKAIRNIEVSLGDGIKKPSKSERKNIKIARKSIVAKCNIKKGETFSEENLTTKRVGEGISPMRWDEIIGKVANRDYKEDEKIEI